MPTHSLEVGFDKGTAVCGPHRILPVSCLAQIELAGNQPGNAVPKWGLFLHEVPIFVVARDVLSSMPNSVWELERELSCCMRRWNSEKDWDWRKKTDKAREAA